MQSDGVSVDIRYKVTGSFGRCPGDDTKHTDTHTQKKKEEMPDIFLLLSCAPHHWDDPEDVIGMDVFLLSKLAYR